jgi:UDP-N-acetylglucosamine--N-acetylmuramyl-(pentapeptide) pyrophosphoryl-undecaprenol N-acetylglucosamine transferase
LIAGGGTGGHVVPALAIGRELRDRYGAEVRFVGTARGLETRMVPEAGFPLELVRSGQLKNVSLATRARTMLDLPLGVLRCVGLVRNFKPDVVVGVGGYASGPAMIAAVLMRVPTLAYEPNAVPGMANRWVGKYVSAAAVNFPETVKYFHNATATGVPVRDEIFTVPDRVLGAQRRLLITAGSNGAKIFNETLPEIAARLLDRMPGLTIVHQTGEKAFATTVADCSGRPSEEECRGGGSRRSCRDVAAGRAHARGASGTVERAVDRRRTIAADECGGPSDEEACGFAEDWGDGGGVSGDPSGARV